LGDRYRDLGQWGQAIPYYKVIWEIGPSELRDAVQLGMAYRLTGRLDEAAAVLESAAGTASTARPSTAVAYYLELAQTYVEQGQMQKAHNAIGMAEKVLDDADRGGRTRASFSDQLLERERGRIAKLESSLSQRDSE
jgi:tetratricopeptide (TPR) repeat protein